MPNGHDMTEECYVPHVLNGLKRFIRVSEVWRGWVPPRSWMQNEPERSEVLAALDAALDAVRDQLGQGHDTAN